MGQGETVLGLRGRVLELLDEYDVSTPGGTAGEPFGSLLSAWLIHVVKERWDVDVDLTDSVFERMTTVDGVVDVLREHGLGDLP